MKDATKIVVLEDFSIANSVEISSICELGFKKINTLSGKKLTYTGTDYAIKVVNSGKLTISETEKAAGTIEATAGGGIVVVK